MRVWGAMALDYAMPGFPILSLVNQAQKVLDT